MQQVALLVPIPSDGQATKAPEQGDVEKVVPAECRQLSQHCWAFNQSHTNQKPLPVESKHSFVAR